jgi:hypothetical protein
MILKGVIYFVGLWRYGYKFMLKILVGRALQFSGAKPGGARKHG